MIMWLKPKPIRSPILLQWLAQAWALTPAEPIKKNKPLAKNAGRMAGEENHIGYDLGRTKWHVTSTWRMEATSKNKPGNRGLMMSYDPRSEQVKIFFNMTNDFHHHSHPPTPRDTVSSLKDYSHFLTGLMPYILAPHQSILHIAASGANHRQSHYIDTSVARECL